MDTQWLSLGGLTRSASHGDAQLKTTTSSYGANGRALGAFVQHLPR